MSGLISRRQGHPDSRPGPKSLYIDGIRYTNAAAKFWPSLLDEVSDDFPDCTRIELCAPASGLLNRDLLFPELALEADIRAMQGRSVRELMKDTLAELELLGPPAAVQVRLLAREKECLATELPPDCVDAETFPFLVVWPLEWAGVPETAWNDASVEGEFSGEDKRRGSIYGLSFRLTITPISEGLHRRCLSVTHTVAMLA